jgi:hypothetical protein
MRTTQAVTRLPEAGYFKMYVLYPMDPASTGEVAMKVLVINREESILPKIVEVEISDKCPKCGEKRGEPFGYNFYEDGSWYFCHQWVNPCGHIDYYADVINESKQEAAQ